MYTHTTQPTIFEDFSHICFPCFQLFSFFIFLLCEWQLTEAKGLLRDPITWTLKHIYKETKKHVQTLLYTVLKSTLYKERHCAFWDQCFAISMYMYCCPVFPHRRLPLSRPEGDHGRHPRIQPALNSAATWRLGPHDENRTTRCKTVAGA